jgi:hypothetical protein
MAEWFTPKGTVMACGGPAAGMSIMYPRASSETPDGERVSKVTTTLNDGDIQFE